ncbi:biopolymer transport protein ExbD [Pirellulimonas nuda]|uniref:Biopolymer transport protein ExbD n=1 Tax=Pirellulimonas nuda TaxID=2528009 RepID=A0A518D919_9BACT|nr:biopolymer transporter ExbD [Pirellulimonas nuda]QDU87976.1 biopolymer transport protein ExbD [Pirellulimonas nuda]
MPLKMQQQDELQLNLTSMIDVVFLLLIFFMVASKFVEAERSIDVKLPRVDASSQPAQRDAPHHVVLDADGRMQLDGGQVDLAALRQTLTAKVQQTGDVGVIIDGDARAAFQHVAAAMAACREAGVTDVSVTVELAGGPINRK